MKHLLEVFALSVKNIGTLTQMRRVTNANLLYRINLNREASFKEKFQKALVKCQTSLNKFQPSMNLKIGGLLYSYDLKTKKTETVHLTQISIPRYIILILPKGSMYI